MNYHGIITIEPGKRSGKPCIRGLRITVYDVLEDLALGMSEAEILEDFPELTRRTSALASLLPRIASAGCPSGRPGAVLLFDQNLSYKLCKVLAAEFPGCQHVREASLSNADDGENWNLLPQTALLLSRRIRISGSGPCFSVRRRNVSGLGLAIA